MVKKNPIAEQSRQWLITSLLNLMDEKDYSKITISEIAERAHLSRRTFYRAFSSKEDILKQYFLSLCDEYMNCFEIGGNYNLREIVRIYFTFWDKHFDLLILLKKNHLFYYLLEEFNKVLPSMHNTIMGNKSEYENQLELNVALLASAGALWNILAEWLQLDNRPSPQEMAQIIIKAIKLNMQQSPSE